MSHIIDHGESSLAEGSGQIRMDELPALSARSRDYLMAIAQRGVPVTYRELAQALALEPPNTIHRVTQALEQLMYEDAAHGRPFLAALVVSKIRGGLPALGFFDYARRLARFEGEPGGVEARDFHAKELIAAVKFWGRERRPAGRA